MVWLAWTVEDILEMSEASYEAFAPFKYRRVLQTYLDSVENDCNDITLAHGLALFCSLVITAMSELTVVVGPSVF